MSKNQGTFHFIALELSRLFRPLKDELKNGRARRLLAEIGIVVTPQQEASIGQSLNNTISKTTVLIQKAAELSQAVQEDKLAAIVKTSAAILPLIKEVPDSFIGIKAAIGALNIPGVPLAVIDKIPERLFNLLLAIYIEQLPVADAPLSFMGIVEKQDQNIGSTDSTKPPFTLTNFHFDRIGNWLSNPKGELKSQYKWGDASFDGKPLFAKLKDVFSRMNLAALYDEAAPNPKLDILLLEATPKINGASKGLELLIKQPITAADGSLSGDDYNLHYKAGFATPIGTKIFIQPGPQTISLLPPSGSAEQGGEISIEQIVKQKSSGKPFILLGQAGGSRFEIAAVGLNAGTKLALNGQPHTAVGKFFAVGVPVFLRRS